MRVDDQIGLLAQHYGAFKQRYILGWIAGGTHGYEVLEWHMIECRSADPTHDIYPTHYHLWGRIRRPGSAYREMAKWTPDGWRH